VVGVSRKIERGGPLRLGILIRLIMGVHWLSLRQRGQRGVEIIGCVWGE
jgi:hypothetical protein